MCEAIGQFGPGLTPPTQDAFRGSLLEEEYERTKCLLQEREAEKMKNGCSIMTDAWSDKKRTAAPARDSLWPPAPRSPDREFRSEPWTDASLPVRP